MIRKKHALGLRAVGGYRVSGQNGLLCPELHGGKEARSLDDPKANCLLAADGAVIAGLISIFGGAAWRAIRSGDMSSIMTNGACWRAHA